MMRNLVAVVVGYLLFAGSAVALFQLSGIDPHGDSSLSFRIAGILYGMVFALASGVVAGRLATAETKGPPLGVAILIAIAGAISLVASPGDHAVWTQVASILLFAPASVLGGWWSRRRRRAPSVG